jgi:hypothetical protein
MLPFGFRFPPLIVPMAFASIPRNVESCATHCSSSGWR